MRGTSHIAIFEVMGKRHSATGETPVVPVRRQDGGFPCGRAGARPTRTMLGSENAVSRTGDIFGRITPRRKGMTSEELKKQIADDEGETVKVKESTDQ